MAVQHKHVAAFAVFVVLAVVGSGFFMTGNAAVHREYSHGLNLYINSVDIPAKMTHVNYHGTATVTNTGASSITFVSYELTLLRPDGTGYIGKQGWVDVIGAGETKTFDLPVLDMPPGTYNVVFKVDTDGRYVETDESDNTHVTKLTAAY